jgi:C1A family cysteine protease
MGLTSWLFGERGDVTTTKLGPQYRQTGRIYSWRPDVPDKRDIYFKLPSGTVPDVADLRPHLSPVEDQGSLGSCTAQAWVAGVEYLDRVADGKHRDYSRLFVYYNERVLDGTVGQDVGAYVRDGAKAIAKWGVAYESTWPYRVSKFAKKPSCWAYAEGRRRRALVYSRLDQTEEQVLAAVGLARVPVVFGFMVYDSFESDQVAQTGMMPMPGPGERALGGHAVAIVGYDRPRRLFVVRNSWGAGWGDRGYFYMPFDYALDGDLAEDFWIIQKVANVK